MMGGKVVDLIFGIYPHGIDFQDPSSFSWVCHSMQLPLDS